MDGHPCETCLRWWECNGVDKQCPFINNQGGNNNENRQTESQYPTTRGSSQAY